MLELRVSGQGVRRHREKITLVDHPILADFFSAALIRSGPLYGGLRGA